MARPARKLLKASVKNSENPRALNKVFGKEATRPSAHKNNRATSDENSGPVRTAGVLLAGQGPEKFFPVGAQRTQRAD